MCFTMRRSRQDVDYSRTCVVDVNTQQNSGGRGGGPGCLGGGGGGGDAYGPNIRTGKNQNHGLQHPAESGGTMDSRSSGVMGVGGGGGGGSSGIGYESVDMISPRRNQNHHGPRHPAESGDQKKNCLSPGGITGGEASGNDFKAERNQNHGDK